MKTYLITYQLDNSNNDYSLISRRIKSFPNWAKIFQRTWIIKTNRNIIRVRDILTESINDAGRILIVDITSSDWAGNHLTDEVTDWMKENV